MQSYCYKNDFLLQYCNNKNHFHNKGFSLSIVLNVNSEVACSSETFVADLFHAAITFLGFHIFVIFVFCID